MKGDDDTSLIINKRGTTSDLPLFTCALKLDKYDYEEKVSNQ
jgi:hypothetical protein